MENLPISIEKYCFKNSILIKIVIYERKLKTNTKFWIEYTDTNVEFDNNFVILFFTNFMHKNVLMFL